MSSSRIGFGKAGGASSPSSTVGYQVIGTGGMDTSIQRNNLEAPCQLNSHSASAVVTYLGINVTTNTISTVVAIKLRVATADGNNSVSVTASTTGWFEDSTHSDTLSDGNLIDVSINCGTSTGSFTARGGACTLTTASGGSHMYFLVNGSITGTPPNNMSFTTVSTTWYIPIGGQFASTASSNAETSETNKSKTTLRAAGTWSNLQCYVSSNGHTATVNNRLNGSNGSQSLSLTFPSTGLFEDTTHTDTVAAGDVANYSVTNNNVNSGTINITFITSKVASSDSKSDVMSSAVTSATSDTNNTTFYGPYGFYHTANSETTEANAQISCPTTSVFSNLRCACTVNSLGGSLTYQFRNNGSNGNQSASIGAGSTGVFEDTLNSDSVTASNKYCYSLSSPGATTGLVISWFASTQSGSQTYSSSSSDVLILTDSADNVATFVETGEDSFILSDTGNQVLIMDIAGSDTIVMSDFSMDSFAPSATRLGFGRWNGGDNPSSTTGYIPITNNGMASSLQSNYDESSVEIATRSNNSILEHLGVNVIINDVITYPTIALRINSSDAANLVTVPPSSTGWFEDAVHTDILATNDGLDVAINCDTTVGNFTITGGAITFTPNDTTAQTYYSSIGECNPTPVFVFGPDSFTTWYFPIGAQSQINTDTGETIETIASKVRLRSGGYYQGLQNKVLTNGMISITTFHLRINGSNGSEILSIGPGITGTFSSLDTDNVLSLYETDFSVTTGTSFALAFLDVAYVAIQFVSYGPTVDLISGFITSQTSTINSGRTYYGPYGAYHTSNATTVESYAQIYCPNAQIHTYLRCAVTQNSLITTIDYTFRNYGIDGYMGCSIGSGSTGVFEDTVNQDVVLKGTKYCYSLSAPGVTTGLIIPWFSTTMMFAPTFDALGTDTLVFDELAIYDYAPAVNVDLESNEELVLEAGELTIQVSLPPGPPVLPAYPYQEYNDDDDILAFFGAYNDYAQAFSDWFQALHLPVYTYAPISGDLLDWVAKGLYGFDRPAISFADQSFIGVLNTYGGNILGYNVEVFIGEENLQLATDDVFRRIITWHLQKSYGKVFNIRWLKRRIIQFLRGLNGVVFNVDQTYDISITFGPPDTVNINFTTGTWTLIDGAFPNLAAPNGTAYNAINATFTTNPGIDGSLLKAAIQSGALELPFQFKYIVNL